jgi:hypothetical protein
MKEKTCDISVVLPVHAFTKETKELFKNAIKSISIQLVIPNEVIIVAPKGSKEVKFLKEFDYEKLNVVIVENDGLTDFSSQVNLGVSKITNKWFSLLEFDDEYAAIWFKNVMAYKAAYQDVGIFLPLLIDAGVDGGFKGFTNEAVWATGFSDELGILDLNALLNYQNFNIAGLAMSKEVFDEIGGFKANLKLTFIYEFLLRMAFKDVKIMTIPKFGYRHLNQREGSLTSEYKETLNPVEAKWWLAQAKKEYYFKEDRKITYEA